MDERSSDRPAPPCSSGRARNDGIHENSPHHANIVAAFIAAIVHVSRAPRPVSTSASAAGSALRGPASHIGDSSTDRRIHSVTSAGSRPARNTARQPNAGSTIAFSAAAAA